MLLLMYAVVDTVCVERGLFGIDQEFPVVLSEKFAFCGVQPMSLLTRY